MKKHRPSLALIWLLLTSPLTGQAPTRHVIKHLSSEAGFPAQQVFSILQDREGFMWFGTNKGLVRYDGAEFVTVQPLTDSVTSTVGNIIRLQEDRKGNIWFFPLRSAPYANVLDPLTHQVRYCTEKGRLMLASYLYEWGDSLYLATKRGIQRLDPKTLEVGELVVDSNFVYPRFGSQWTDKWGRFWGRSKKTGMACYDPAARKTYNREDEHQDPYGWEIFDWNPDHRRFAQEANGNTWMTTADGEFFYFNFETGKLLRHDFEHYIPKIGYDRLKTVTVDRDGRVWFGTETGEIYQYFLKKDSFALLAAPREGPQSLEQSIWVDALYTDREGNVWTNVDGGLNLFNPSRQKIAAFKTRPDSVRHWKAVTDFLQTKRGDIFVCYAGSGVDHFNANFKKIETLEVLDGQHPRFKSWFNFALVEAEHGKIWIGGDMDFNGDGKGDGWITEYDPQTKAINYFPCDVCDGSPILRFHKIPSGDIWMSVNNYEGLVKWSAKQRTFKKYPIPAPDRFSKLMGRPWHINTFYQESPHRLWVGTHSYGVILFDPIKGQIISRHYTHESGTEEDQTDNNVNCIMPWRPDSLLIGTDTGLKLLDVKSGAITHLPVNEKLPNLFVASLYLDPSGNTWLTGTFGLCCIDPSLTNVKVFDWSDGISPQSLRAVSGAFYKLRDGRLLVGSALGQFFMFHPDALLAGRPPLPAPVITNLSIGSVPALGLAAQIRKGYSPTFTHDQNALTISYGSLTYSNTGIIYHYQLIGLDTSWTNAGARRQVNYTNLPPGQYQFRVRATMLDGQQTEAATFSFEIRPPWWRTSWFYALIVLTLAALAYAVARDRIRRFRERTTYEKRLSDLENQALRAQINPHFIFNALQAVKLFVLQNDVPQAEHYMSRFARLMRQIMDNSRQSTVPLRQELDLLDNYLLLEQLRFGHAWDYRFDLDDEVQADEISVPSMTLQPFVENAVLHGLAHLRSEQRGLLTVRCSLLNGGLLIAVEDNGVGRARAELMKNTLRREHHRSAGLDITARRLALFSEGAAQPARYTVFDLADETGAGCGTRVEVWLPGEGTMNDEL